MKLCSPAKFYAILSAFYFMLMIFQNIGSSKFCLGIYSCSSNPFPVLLGNALYIILWTWLLNIICQFSPTLSWFIVLIPYLLVFILMGFLFEATRDLREHKGTTKPMIHSCIQCGKPVDGFCVNCRNLGLIH